MSHSTAEKYSENNYPFLKDGGEISELIREFDWESTSLGKIETWSESLRTTVGIVLHSAFPMFLFWGEDLICFYNDVFRPSLGVDGKHPAIGKKGREVWPEIWDFIGPLIEQVMTTGTPVKYFDQLVPFYRNGRMEDIYWTFCYSAAFGNDGKICGVVVTCTETTETVLTKKKLEESERRLRSMILQAPVAIGIYRGKDYVTEMANSRALELWGRTEEEVLNKPILEAMPELKNQGIKELLDEVYETGKIYNASEQHIQIFRNGRLEDAFFNYSFEPLFDIEGKINGIMAVGIEVTEQVNARQKITDSEARFRAVADNIPNLAWMAHADGWIYWYNKKWHEYTGTTPEQMEGWGWKSVHDPEVLPKVVERWQTSLKEGKSFEMIFPLKGADGKFRQFLTRVLPVYDINGKISQWFGSNTDVTDQVEAQKMLEESERKFRLLADSMPQHIWTADPQGNLNYYNKSVYEYTGLSYEELNADGWFQVVHPDDREKNIKEWNESVEEGKDFLLEHRFRRHDGEYRWQLSRAIPQRDEEGNIQMWVGTSTDIHEIKEQVQKKDYFISIASHELKTPLTTAKGYVDMLMLSSKEENQPAHLYIQKANQSINKLEKMIAELLEVSKIQNGQLSYNFSTFDFDELINQTIENILHTSRKHMINKTGNCTHPVTGDKERLEQVLINLLSNAIKYSPEAEKILVEVKENDNSVEVKIKDYGVGISKEHLKKIFDRYYRVEDHTRYFQGLGIGLYICQEIIRRHKGKINAESEPGKGSIFYFSIPFNSSQ